MGVVTEAWVDRTDISLVNNLVVKGVVGKLMSVHYCSWHLYWTHKSKVTVALVVRHRLNLILI